MSTTADSVLVPLAEGFEEIEAVTIIDVLRRADLEVVVAGLASGPVTGAHGIAVGTDCDLADIDPASIGTLVLPGGMPGTTHLMEDERVLALVRELHGSGRRTAAICAAPMVLARAGVVDGVPVTSHPSVRDRLGRAEVDPASRVVSAGTVVTSQGAGTAMEFALRLAAELVGEERAAELGRAMIVMREA